MPRGIEHPSAKLFPVANAGRHLAMYDPATRKLAHIGTCFGTHHLMFAEDANHTLWTSGGGQVIGWLNTRMFEETGDEMKSQGWTALIRDANGNGKRDAYTEPGQPLDAAKDQRINGALYAVAPAPDGCDLGHAARLSGRGHSSVTRGDPPETAITGIFQPPTGQGLLAARRRRRSQRRLLGGDGQRPSRQLRSPQVQGAAERPERQRTALPGGLDVLLEPVPQLKGVTDSGSAEASYYTWVDQFDTLGLGDTRRSTPATPPKGCWR